MERIAASQPAQTQLPGGEFEDIAIFFQSGWRAFQHRMAGVQAAWGLTPAAAHSGHLGVLLKAEPADPAAAAPCGSSRRPCGSTVRPCPSRRDN